MKLALLVGRGFEGAGVTRYVCELYEYLTKHKIDVSLFTIDDKKWPRAKSQELPPYENIDEDNIDSIHNVLNTFNFVFINSVPSIKHSQWAIDGFLNLIKRLDNPKKIIFQNDHKIASIHRNANFFELCNLADGIVSHSITSPFFNKLVELYGVKIKNKFIQLHVGFNFSQLNKYRKENHLKKITYLGRFATFKDPERLYKFLPYSKENNLLLEMKGVERSLGALPIFYDDIEKRIPRKDMIEVSTKALKEGLIVDNDKRDLSKIYIWGPYEYVDGMETLSSSLVGADFYHLDAMAYGDNFEYAQCEIIGVGCVPMFDYHWAENCYVHNNGKKLDKKFIHLDNYGLFIKKDGSNIKEIVEKINEISSNKKLHKQYLDTSFEVTVNHCDSKFIFNNLIEDIQTIKKSEPLQLLTEEEKKLIKKEKKKAEKTKEEVPVITLKTETIEVKGSKYHVNKKGEVSKTKMLF